MKPINRKVLAIYIEVCDQIPHFIESLRTDTDYLTPSQTDPIRIFTINATKDKINT